MARVKAPIKAPIKPKTPKISNDDGISKLLNYILIIILLLLIVYIGVYIHSAVKSTKEAFTDNQSSSSSKYHVIYIYSDSCGFCTKFTPEFMKFQEILKQNPDKFNTIVSATKYTYDDPSVSIYSSVIKAFPAVLVVDEKGAVKEKFFGYKPVDTLVDQVKKSVL